MHPRSELTKPSPTRFQVRLGPFTALRFPQPTPAHQPTTHNNHNHSHPHPQNNIPLPPLQSLQNGSLPASLSFTCPTAYLRQVLGRVIHLGVDAILVSTVLAGIKRSTGLQYPPLPCPGFVCPPPPVPRACVRADYSRLGSRS